MRLIGGDRTMRRSSSRTLLPKADGEGSGAYPPFASHAPVLVEDALQRILDSRTLRRSQRHRSFLLHVVRAAHRSPRSALRAAGFRRCPSASPTPEALEHGRIALAHELLFVSLPADPTFDPYRDHPAFVALMAEFGLPRLAASPFAVVS